MGLAEWDLFLYRWPGSEINPPVADRFLYPIFHFSTIPLFHWLSDGQHYAPVMKSKPGLLSQDSLHTCKYYKCILIHFILDYFNRILGWLFGIIGKNTLCLLKFKIEYSDRGWGVLSSEVQSWENRVRCQIWVGRASVPAEFRSSRTPEYSRHRGRPYFAEYNSKGKSEYRMSNYEYRMSK